MGESGGEEGEFIGLALFHAGEDVVLLILLFDALQHPRGDFLGGVVEVEGGEVALEHQVVEEVESVDLSLEVVELVAAGPDEEGLLFEGGDGGGLFPDHQVLLIYGVQHDRESPFLELHLGLLVLILTGYDTYVVVFLLLLLPQLRLRPTQVITGMLHVLHGVGTRHSAASETTLVVVQQVLYGLLTLLYAVDVLGVTTDGVLYLLLFV